MADSRIWIVRAGARGVLIDDFRSNNLVALGELEVGKLADRVSDADLERLYAEAFPTEREGTRRVWIAQVKRFRNEIKVGDTVGTYDRAQRLYLLGEVESETLWRDVPHPHYRRVKWLQQVQRDVLTAKTRNALGSIATFFRVREDASAEMLAKATALGQVVVPVARAVKPEETPLGGESESEIRAEVLEKAEEFIEDRISALNWQQMQELVAGILRGMGYITQVSPEGADRGVDIFASPDGLGLQEPRIFVEVKHRPGTPMSADEVRGFLGGRRAGDRCLYVSTGGFTKDARYEAERSNVPLTLIPLPRLREEDSPPAPDSDSRSRGPGDLVFGAESGRIRRRGLVCHRASRSRLRSIAGGEDGLLQARETRLADLGQCGQCGGLRPAGATASERFSFATSQRFAAIRRSSTPSTSCAGTDRRPPSPDWPRASSGAAGRHTAISSPRALLLPSHRDLWQYIGNP